MAGRTQVYKYWVDCLSHDGSASLVPQIGADHEMLSELIQGLKQFMFSEHMNQLVNPYVAHKSVMRFHLSHVWIGY